MENEETKDFISWEEFKKREMTTKDAVLRALAKRRKHYVEAAEKDVKKPAAFYAEILEAFDTLIKRIENMVIFDELPERWVYDFEITYYRSTLDILHVKSITEGHHGEGSFSWQSDSRFHLIHLIAVPLTVAEYAEIYGAEQGTVRQWIRRGKIRTAAKYGNEWRIPSLTPPPGKGYEPAQYIWYEELKGLPEEYQFLNDYKLATFFQDPKEKAKYHVMLVSKKTTDCDHTENNKELICDAKEVQKLELVMIGHPDIIYSLSF